MSMNKMIRIYVAMIAACALGACGQRGALYLPEASRNVVVTPAPSAPPASPAASPAETPADAATTETEEQRRNSTAPAK